VFAVLSWSSRRSRAAVTTEALRNLASRTGMKELTLRSLRHGAAVGNKGDEAAAAMLAAELGTD